MWQTIKAIPRVPDLSAAEFEERFLKPDVPVIVAGAVKDWPACRLWTLEHLCEQLQAVPQSVPVASWAPPHESLTSFRIARLPVAEYVANLKRGDFTWYGANGWKFHFFPSLQGDVRTPPFLDHFRVSQRNLWFSGPGAKLPTHYDSGSPYGVNAQVKGSKMFRLVSGAHLAEMCPIPGGNFSRVCNLMKPDFERFPSLRRIPCWEGVLSAGDALFIPANWFHYVEHIGDFNVNLQF